MHSLNIPGSEYEEYVKQFNPVKFDAKKWVATAKNAGVDVYKRQVGNWSAITRI